MPAFPLEKKIWVAPFHTAGVENADRYHSVYQFRSDDPWRDRISLQIQLLHQMETRKCSECGEASRRLTPQPRGVNAICSVVAEFTMCRSRPDMEQSLS